MNEKFYFIDVSVRAGPQKVVFKNYPHILKKQFLSTRKYSSPNSIEIPYSFFQFFLSMFKQKKRFFIFKLNTCIFNLNIFDINDTQCRYLCVLFNVLFDTMNLFRMNTMSSSYELSSKNTRATSEMRNLRGSSEVTIEYFFMC